MPVVEVFTNSPQYKNANGVFLKWSRAFTEFNEFRESGKSLKHDLGSI